MTPIQQEWKQQRIYRQAAIPGELWKTYPWGEERIAGSGAALAPRLCDEDIQRIAEAVVARMGEREGKWKAVQVPEDAQTWSWRQMVEDRIHEAELSCAKNA